MRNTWETWDQDKLARLVADTGGGQDALVGHALELRERGIDAHGWDPHFYPDTTPLLGRYDTVTCLYVHNVIPPTARATLVDQLMTLRADAVYCAVRTDLDDLHVKTKRGTQQWLVELPYPIVTRNSLFMLYRMR